MYFLEVTEIIVFELRTPPLNITLKFCGPFIKPLLNTALEVDFYSLLNEVPLTSAMTFPFHLILWITFVHESVLPSRQSAISRIFLSVVPRSQLRIVSPWLGDPDKKGEPDSSLEVCLPQASQSNWRRTGIQQKAAWNVDWKFGYFI
jgi:hypothetical protein